MKTIPKLFCVIGLACIACISAAAPSAAAPVFLECAVSNGSSAVTWQVTLDEATGNVSYSIPSLGASYRYHGTFTRDSVTFDTVQISRIDLTFKRTVAIEGSIKSETGLCKIVNQPARQF
ncbi:MAG TPA: hypothetical protein VGN04_11505 [Herbaspirillum sp.]